MSIEVQGHFLTNEVYGGMLVLKVKVISSPWPKAF